MKEMYQQLQDELYLEVDLDYRFNHTVDSSSPSDSSGKDKNEVFEHIAQYLPNTEGSDTFTRLVYYILLLMTFLRPLFDLWRFKTSFSFYNDCVDSNTFRTKDKQKGKRKEPILPLKESDKDYFREKMYYLPKGAKRERLLISCFWPSLMAWFLVMVATFATAVCNIDMAVSSLDLTSLTRENKHQIKEAQRAAQNNTFPGIFSKNAKDFYKSMKTVMDDDGLKSLRSMDYAKRHKQCEIQLLAPRSNLLPTLYLYAAIVTVCNVLDLMRRLVYGKYLEHFYPNYKMDRVVDLMTRIKETRATLAALLKQVDALAKKNRKGKGEKIKGKGKKIKGKKKKKKKRKKKKSRQEKKKPSQEKKEPSQEKREPSQEKREPSQEKREPSQKKREPSQEKREPSQENREPSQEKRESSQEKRSHRPEPGGGLGPEPGGSEVHLKARPPAKKPNTFIKIWARLKQVNILKRLSDSFGRLIRLLFPKMELFFLQKLICTSCLRTTTYQLINHCVHPGCGAALCQACARRCHEKNHDKCPDCGQPFIIDFTLRFPLQLSPTRSLCEEDLEPWDTHPGERFGCMKPLTVCTECGKNYVLNPLLEVCIVCRRGGVRDLDPRKYEERTPKPADSNARIRQSGWLPQPVARVHVDQKHGLTGKKLNPLEILVKYCLQVYFKLYYDIKVHYRLEDGPKHILTQLRVMRSQPKKVQNSCDLQTCVQEHGSHTQNVSLLSLMASPE
ncbi:hypothetical protein GWK47_009520 [Chionoecetes opilio]|uniref:Uncharacterized protein n=1 Tax=Chionoecetes opilio TaxID=41210 RepID=A0A8J5CN54_CHIOP|nr:hypothetical protein GWK47_009520 [Chionoecetes opilio]